MSKLRPRDYQSIQYKMVVHRLNIFYLKYKALNQEISQNQDSQCVWEGVQTEDLAILGLHSLNEGSLYVQHALDNLPVPTSLIFFFFFNPFCVSLIQLPDWPNKHVFLTHALTQQPSLRQPVPGRTPALWSGCSASP